MKKCITLFLLLQVMFCSGQEVLNKSFEIREFLPSPPLDYYYQMQACKHWAVATYSSDWLSTEVGSDALEGYEPRTGTGHARFAGTGVHPGDAYKEMIRGEVTGLIAGTEYNISFWVKRIDGMTNMKVGAYLSTTIPSIHENPADPYTQSFFPQIEGVVAGENSSYVKISGCFTPSSSGLHYITIGVFEVYPGVEGEELNFFIVDDVDVHVATGALPMGTIALEDEYCAADDIIADATSTMNYERYQWQVCTSSGDLVYATEIIDGTASTFDVKTTMAANGTPLLQGNCYRLKLVLYGLCKIKVTKEFCITSSFITLYASGDPFCEDDPITVYSDGAGDWFYSWSTGESGFGLTSITSVADLSTSTYSVTATSGAGCSVTGSVSVIVHPNPNLPPELTTDEYTYYIYPHEELCFTLFSTDHPNENVGMTIFDKPTGAEFTKVFVNQEYGTFCWTPTELDYGVHEFTIYLQDNSACGSKSRSYQFRVEVLCPLCPICVYYDGNSPDSDPLPELTEAVQCIEAGTTEEVETGSDPVVFRAGKYIELNEFYADGDFTAEIVAISCADECAECCENWTGFTYDEPLPNIFTPNGDGINDFWFLNDSDNSYCAFNAFGYRIRVMGRWAGAGVRYEREFTAEYCCPFEAANAETGLSYTAIHWDGYDKWGNLVSDGVYDVYVDLYGCGEDVLLWAEVQVIGGSTSLVQNGESSELKSVNDWKDDQQSSDLGLENEALRGDLDLLLYPSPATDNLNVIVRKSVMEEVNVTVYNIQGKPFYNRILSETNTDINLVDWPAGIYYVQVRTSKESVQKKFIKH
ncbi:MAG: T9SS type A sorting domain-containing protein [Bacteroidota bacterium]